MYKRQVLKDAQDGLTQITKNLQASDRLQNQAIRAVGAAAGFAAQTGMHAADVGERATRTAEEALNANAALREVVEREKEINKSRDQTLLAAEYSIEYNRIQAESSQSVTFEARIYNKKINVDGYSEHVKFTGVTDLSDAKAASNSAGFSIALAKTTMYAGVAFCSAGNSNGFTGAMGVTDSALCFVEVQGSNLMVRSGNADLVRRLRSGESNAASLRFVLSPTGLQPGYSSQLSALTAQYRRKGLAV